MIETIPNVSEGRDATVLGELVDAATRFSGATLLDYSADPSHNRSVFTLAGSPDGVRDAVLSLMEVAVRRIDLTRHHGEHPRIGAVDVVPFVPLRGATMADCVTLAHDTARRIGERFAVPVFLYEQAATTPARRRLEVVRRGGFEGLASKMTQPEWQPDYGPAVPHPRAGATVVGARMPLIAFNVNLATDRLDVARAVAAAVRESSGGLPCVKALGVWLRHRGLAQVSMNLTDYTRTPVEVAYDRVAREAAQRGVDVLESELIGLIPAAALASTTATHLRLTGFRPSQVLEVRLQERMPR